MSLTSYRAAPPRDVCPGGFYQGLFLYRLERMLLFRFGGDLLSHVLRRSTIGATALNGRVRDGIGCFARAMSTKPKKKQAVRERLIAVLELIQHHDWPFRIANISM